MPKLTTLVATIFECKDSMCKGNLHIEIFT